MGKSVYLLAFTFFCFSATAWSQEEVVADTAKAWEVGAGIGADLSQLFQLNPRQGAGQNKIGFGGAVNIFANYSRRRVSWENTGLLQFGVQKLGSGKVILGSGEVIDVPFQKAIDDIRLNSKFGFKTSENSKFFYAANFNFLSQLAPTYQGPTAYPGNFLSPVTEARSNPVSKFFSPAFTTLSVGIDYKPTPQLSIYYSPVGAKFVIVADDAIAALNVHGNPEGQNVDAQFGSLMRVAYNDKYANDKIIFTSALNLYSNYLNNPENIDVDWNNELAYSITTGLKLSLLVNVFYDDDIRVQITDLDDPGGVRVDENGNIVTGKRVSVTQQLLLTYALTL